MKVRIGNYSVEIRPPLSDLYCLAARIVDRSVSEEAALASVREGTPADVRIEALEDCTVLSARLVEVNPDHTYYFWRLILAFTEAKYGHDRDSPWWFAADLFVEMTRRSLNSRPRGDRQREALRTVDLQLGILERRIARLARRGGLLSKRRRNMIKIESAELAETRLGAGWLLAGPYCTQLDPDDFDCSVAQWGAPFYLRGGVYSVHTAEDKPATPETTEFLRKLDPGRSISEPRWALAEALGHLNAALHEAKPSTRGRCQLKRIRVLSLLARLDPERESEHWKAAAAAAEVVGRTVFPADGLDEFYRALAPVARYIGQQSLRLQALLPVPLEDLRAPGPLLVELLANVTAFVEDPDDLNAMWAVIHTILADGENLSISPRVWTDLAHKIPGNRLRCIPGPVDFAELMATVDETCARAGASSDERAATLVHAALHVRAEDVAEVVGLLDKIHEVDRDFPVRYAWMLDYLLLSHRKRYAARLDEAGEYHKALLEYFVAAEGAALCAERHRSAGLATDLVNRSLSVVKRAGYDGELVSRVVLLLKTVEPIVTGLLGPEVERASFVQGLGQEIARLVIRADTPELFAEHQILFKGFDFRLVVQNSGPRRLAPAVEDLNAKIAAKEGEDGPYVPDRLGYLDDVVGIPGGTTGLFFVSPLEVSPGDETEASCGNLRRVADHKISDGLIQAFWWNDTKLARPAPFEMTEHATRGLGDETVLISLYLTEHDEKGAEGAFSVGTSLVSCHLTTQDLTVNITKLGLPGSLFSVHSPNHNAALHWHFVTFPVAEVREEVNVDPLGSAVTLRGAEVLEQYFRLGGVTAAQLQEWRAQGKKHLCFWPHGPLHYLPFHLLQVDGRPLADDWTVTTVGTSAHFLPRPTGTAGRRRLLIAGSSAGGAKYGLPEQPQIAEHVRNLADQVTGARRLEDGATTPRALMQALKDIDFLHIAAHGSQDVEAPWYHCLYLDPEEDDGDGRLFAHQILGLDLRGVELVTLSACESALGRYDLNDNLRGLPAAFLAAGASTVIGVLWPVTAPVATLFFEELYSHLLADNSKRDAFRHAQRATRNAHPQYLHWGAFTMMGDWR